MSEAASPVIKVNGLYKIFRLGEERVRALNNVSFEVKKGEFIAVVGTSGSGKSTLLNMLSGLEKPTKGEIIVAGEHIESLNEQQLVRFRREHVGFVFQSYNLLPSMNAAENVELPLIFRGVDRDRRKKAALKALKMVGLLNIRDHKPGEMSGGQQQRVGIARALVSGPKIVFADEPTGNLDSQSSREILEILGKMVKEEGRTLIMVTHDNDLALFADRIIRIKDGSIESDYIPEKQNN